MRERKFRAWDIYKKKFIPEIVWAIEPDGGRATGVMILDWEDYTAGEHFYPEHQDVMEFIGIKDKTGKPIFEGDIAKSDHYTNKNEYIVFKWDEEICSFKGNLYSDGDGIECEDIYFIANDGRKYEVIGNIYENPNLLQTV